jgi:hypothetical protein
VQLPADAHGTEVKWADGTIWHPRGQNLQRGRSPSRKCNLPVPPPRAAVGILGRTAMVGLAIAELCAEAGLYDVTINVDGVIT